MARADGAKAPVVNDAVARVGDADDGGVDIAAALAARERKDKEKAAAAAAMLPIDDDTDDEAQRTSLEPTTLQEPGFQKTRLMSLGSGFMLRTLKFCRRWRLATKMLRAHVVTLPLRRHSSGYRSRPERSTHRAAALAARAAAPSRGRRLKSGPRYGDQGFAREAAAVIRRTPVPTIRRECGPDAAAAGARGPGRHCSSPEPRLVGDAGGRARASTYDVRGAVATAIDVFGAPRRRSRPSRASRSSSSLAVTSSPFWSCAQLRHLPFLRQLHEVTAKHFLCEDWV